MRTPFRGRNPELDNLAYTVLVSGMQVIRQQTNALLDQGWISLRHVTLSLSRIGGYRRRPRVKTFYVRRPARRPNSLNCSPPSSERRSIVRQTPAKTIRSQCPAESIGRCPGARRTSTSSPCPSHGRVPGRPWCRLLLKRMGSSRIAPRVFRPRRDRRFCPGVPRLRTRR